jgi:hypothetical protein
MPCVAVSPYAIGAVVSAGFAVLLIGVFVIIAVRMKVRAVIPDLHWLFSFFHYSFFFFFFFFNFSLF